MKSVKISMVLLFMVVFAMLFSANALADLSQQQTSVLAIYTLFKPNAQAVFSNNIRDKAEFQRLYPLVVDKIKKKGPEYYNNVPVFSVEVTTKTGKETISVEIEGDVFAFIEKKAEQFTDTDLTIAYKRYVGAPKYDVDKSEFKLTVDINVLKALDDLLNSGGDALIVNAKHASDGGNPRINFARRTTVGGNFKYSFEKTISFSANVEEDITFTVANSYDFGYGLVDDSDNMIDSVTKRFNRNSGAQTVELNLKLGNKPTKRLEVGLKYETEKGKTDNLNGLGLSLSDLPPVKILESETATGPFNEVAEKRGSVIEHELTVGKYYKIVYTRDFLQYKLNRIEQDLGQISAATVTNFHPVYELSSTLHPVEIRQTGGRELTVKIHKDDYTGVDLRDRSKYSIVKTADGSVIEPRSVSVTTEGDWEIAVLNVELEEGAYELKLENRYKLNTFPFMDRIEKSVENGQVTYSPPPGGLVRVVGDKNIAFTATHNLASGASGAILGSWYVQKDSGEEHQIGSSHSGRIEDGFTPSVTGNALTLEPHQPGTYIVKYKINRKVDKTEQGGVPVLKDIPVLELIFSYEKKVKSDTNIETGEWTVTVTQDNNAENGFTTKIAEIKDQAATNYETAKSNREKIQSRQTPADTVSGRDTLKTEAVSAIDRALKLLETDAIKLIASFRTDKLGEAHPKLITEKSLVDQQIRLYKEEKAAITALDTSDPSVEYDSAWFTTNLEFEPKTAERVNVLSTGHLELRIKSGVTSNDPWSKVDKKWIYKSKSTSTATIKEGTNTVFDFSPVPNSVLELVITEKQTGRNEVVYRKSWDIEASVKPKVVASVSNRAANEFRVGDTVTFKVLPVSMQITEDEYNKLFEKYMFKVMLPSKNIKTKITTDNTVTFKLEESGEFKVKAIVKSTTYPNYDNLESEDFTFTVADDKTAAGRQDYIASANRNAEAGKRLVNDAVNTDGTVDNNKREEGKKLIEKAIQDYKTANDSFDAELKLIVAADPQDTILEQRIQEISSKIDELNTFLSDNFESINGQLFFLKPDDDKFLRGAAVEFALGRVNAGDDFKWESNKPNAWQSFTASGSKITAKLKDDAELGYITVTATQYKDGNPLKDSSDKVIQVTKTISVIEAEVSRLEVVPASVYLELGETQEFTIITDVQNIVPSYSILTGSDYVETVTPSSGKIIVKLKDTIAPNVAGTGVISISVYSQRDNNVKANLEIRLSKQNTVFRITNDKAEYKVSEAVLPIQLDVAPDIPKENIRWEVLNEDRDKVVGEVNNNNQLKLKNPKVNDNIFIVAIVGHSKAIELGLANEIAEYSFTIVQDDDVSELRVAPDNVELIMPIPAGLAGGTVAFPITLTATSSDPSHRIEWSIVENNPKISLTATDNTAVITALPDAVAGSTYTVLAKAGTKKAEVRVTIASLSSNVIKVSGTDVNIKAAPNEKTRTTKTTSESITYFRAESTDDKIYLKLDGKWYELPAGRSEELFIDKYYLKKARGI